MVISKVLITGSSDGLGLAAGKRLLAAGHEVALHARHENRAKDAQEAAPAAAAVVTRNVAECSPALARGCSCPRGDRPSHAVSFRRLRFRWPQVGSRARWLDAERRRIVRRARRHKLGWRSATTPRRGRPAAIGARNSG